MLINLSELFSVDGKEKTYTQDIEMTDFHAPDGVYTIISKAPVRLWFRNLGDRKLHMKGSIDLTVLIPCGRCLEPVEYQLQTEFEQELNLEQSDEERVEDLNEQPYISGYHLDVDQLVSNELVLNLPMKILCSDDCKGICNRCGVNLNHETCSCDQSSPDPRMAAIQDIFKQFKEV